MLHDAVEDGDLLLYETPPAVREALIAISRRQGETYADYILRVAEHPLARLVKRADLDTNLARMDEAHESLRPRYEAALARLTASPSC